MSEKIKKISPNNWWRALNSFLGFVAICLLLYYVDVLHLPPGCKSSYQSHADWFLVIVSIVAIIGAIWAVLARIDAEKAFTQSKETYDALSNSFMFTQIYEDERLPKIYNCIGEERVTVTLFLNFPIVGLFEKDDPKFVEKAKETFTTILIPKLEKLMDSFPHKFKLNIACYTKSFTMSFLTAPELADEKRRVENFYTLIEALAVKYKDPAKFNRFYFDKDIGLRIALVIPDIKKGEGDALVWTVSDFTPATASSFDTASFKTMDRYFIMTLDKMFENFKDKADKSESITFQITP